MHATSDSVIVGPGDFYAGPSCDGTATTFLFFMTWDRSVSSTAKQPWRLCCGRVTPTLHAGLFGRSHGRAT